MTHHEDHDRTTRWPESALDLVADLWWQAPDGSVCIVECKQYEGPARPADDTIPIECPVCAADRDWPEVGASALTVAASGAYFDQGDVITALPPRGLVVEGWTEAAWLATLLLTPPSADHEPDAAEFGRMVTMLRHWDQLAQRPHLPSFTIEVLSQPCDMTRAGWQAITAARCAVQAAYLARDAVVHEHPSIGRQVVGEYVVRWLGLRPTAEIVEAAANALLQAPLDGTHPDGDHAVVRRLLAATRTQRRAWRPLGETKIRHARIDSLDRRLPGVGNEQPLVLADTVGTCDQPDAATAGWNDPRIPRVLARLHPAERRVALAYVHADPDTTWAQAAQQCGQEAAFGERVRRKLLREGRLLTTWLAASGPMHRAA